MKFSLLRYDRVSLLVITVMVALSATLSFPASLFGQEPTKRDAQILIWLRELKPLPKVHYSWPLPFAKISDELLFEYTRLTHAASLSGEWGKSEQVERAVVACKRVNESKPAKVASLAINYSVWHRRFGKKLPPTDVGPTHDEELKYMTERLEFMRTALAQSNKKHQTNIAVSAILFDSEHFHKRHDDEAWNKAITAKYDVATNVVKKIFPDARIEWYARGAMHPSASSTGWSEAAYFTLEEKANTFACSLYSVPEIGYTREIYRRTAANAEKHGCDEITPWVALAAGYRRQTEKYHEWSHDWNYELIYSWQLGREINHNWFGMPERTERFAPWNKAKIVIFYPEPFGRASHWAEHFIAYVRGANGVKTLPSDE